MSNQSITIPKWILFHWVKNLEEIFVILALPPWVASWEKSVLSFLFSPSFVSNSLQPHELQHARPPCPSPTPRVYSMSIESVMPSNHLILCRPFLLPPSIFPSIRVFSNESFLHIRWPKYWSFSFSISPSNDYSGLISFRIDWLDLLAVQGTLKSLLQHHSSKVPILPCSASCGEWGQILIAVRRLLAAVASLVVERGL